MMNFPLSLVIAIMGAVLAQMALSQSVPKSVQSDIQAWGSANNFCRGVSDPKIYEPACELREQLTQRLNSKGYCGGEGGWKLCGPTPSIRVLADCGASAGYTHLFRTPGFTGPRDAFQSDGVDGGNFQLVYYEGQDQYDIAFTDIARSTTYREQGFVVIGTTSDNGFINVVAVSQDDVFETYSFDLRNQYVIWTSHKTGTPVPKGSIFWTKC